MAGRKGRRGWGRIRQLPTKGKRYQASYVWPRGGDRQRRDACRNSSEFRSG